MVFEDWEIDAIKTALVDNENLFSVVILNKLEKIQSESRNKRYSLRSTDWLSEAGKKNKFKKLKREEGDLL